MENKTGVATLQMYFTFFKCLFKSFSKKLKSINR